MITVESELNKHYYLSDVNDVILLLSMCSLFLKRLNSMVYIVVNFFLKD